MQEVRRRRRLTIEEIPPIRYARVLDVVDADEVLRIATELKLDLKKEESWEILYQMSIW